MKCNYLVLSDIHLGHKRNKTSDIIRNLDVMFDHYSNSSKFTSLDMIFIAGDLFDRLLDFSIDDMHEAALWIGRLMHFCSAHQIVLRILEGTPSHDWKQSRLAETISGLMTIPCDFRYIDSLHIEYHKELQLHILYVPDEWTANTDLTFSQVRQLLSDEGIQEVDIAIMHGLFSYQLKDVPGVNHKHSEADYLGIVRYFINIGHIHNFSTFDRIVAQGSTDRLCHGEEEAKGFVRMYIDSELGNRFEFIENKGAKIFKTITLRNPDLDISVAQIDKIVSRLPSDSHIRVKAKKGHPVLIAFEDLKVRHPLLHWVKQTDDEVEKPKVRLLVDNAEYIPVTINKENIIPMLMNEIDVRHKLEPRKRELLLGLLSEIRDQS